MAAVIALSATTFSGCNQRGRHVVAIYERPSGRLVRLDTDVDGDGRLDQRTYMNGNVPLRAEIDVTQDGRIDRWEYLDDRGQLRRLGTSSANDGVEDVWTQPVGPDGQRLVERARARDRRVDRRDYYASDRLVRAEEDNNADGLTDRWELHSPDGRVIAVQFDTTLKRGWPDRRLRYSSDGRLADVAADDDGDGTFEPLPPDAVPSEEPREQN